MSTQIPSPIPGPAFPPATQAADMSTLDWFAGQALAGLISTPDTVSLSPDKIAIACYDCASAMLAESKRRQS